MWCLPEEMETGGRGGGGAMPALVGDRSLAGVLDSWLGSVRVCRREGRGKLEKG